MMNTKMEVIRNLYIAVFGYSVFGATTITKFMGVDLFHEINDLVQFIVLLGGAVSLAMTIWFNVKNWKVRRNNLELERKIKEQELERLTWENDNHPKEKINTVFEEKPKK